QTKKVDASNVQSILDLQKATQQDLADDLLNMAKALKSNTLLFGETLKKDNELVQEASEIVSKNYTNAQNSGGRLAKYNAKAWSTTGLNWMIVAVVVAVFSFLILFMKVVPKRY
ncbi:Vesicle transport protein USE1, partial [Smittium culicis]